MDKDWNIVEVLRHSRHDWLNRLQLIKGNLDLNRIDRAKAVIDEIVIEMQQEAKLSNMKLPEFAALLLKYNWENSSIQLEYEVLQDSASYQIDERQLISWTSSLLACLNQSIDEFQENHLSITIDSEKNGVRFFFDFNGIIINREQMEKFLTDQTSLMESTVKEFTRSELSIEVFMPMI